MIKLEVDTDLTPFALVRAYDQITEKLCDEGTAPEVEYKITWTIKCASQNLQYVIPIAHVFGFKLEVDTSYDQDKWSLTGYYFANTKHSVKEVSMTVWSPGA